MATPSPRVQITKRLVQALASNPPEKASFHRDSELPGFGIKVSTKGKVSFIAEARIKRGGSKRVTVGSYPILSVQEARDRARAALTDMKDGKDPIADAKEQAELAARAKATKKALSVTLGTVFESFLRARALKPKTIVDYKSTVTVCFGDWLAQPIRDITRKQVEERFFEIAQRTSTTRSTSGKAQASKAMRYLSAIMNYAMADDVEGHRLLTDNPVSVLKQKKIDRSIKRRERYLTERELEVLFSALAIMRHPQYKQSLACSEHSIDLVLLIIYTGLRKMEGATLRWEDVDFSNRYFLVRDTKNKQEHIVPMSDQVQALLKRRAAAKPDGVEWVFPGRHGKGHIKEIRSDLERMGRIVGSPFMIHDLRRTFATLADEAGVPFEAIKRALNHKTGDVTHGYIISRAESMRETFQKVADMVGWWVWKDPPGGDNQPEGAECSRA